MSTVLKGIASPDGVVRAYSFHCPGCDSSHTVQVAIDPAHPNGCVWDWNGSVERPTFTPSLLMRQGHYAYDEPRDRCWCTWNRDHPEQPSGFTCQRCHSFIADGVIDFLSDCTHALRGKHPLPPHPRIAQSESST